MYLLPQVWIVVELWPFFEVVSYLCWVPRKTRVKKKKMDAEVPVKYVQVVCIKLLRLRAKFIFK